MRASETLECAIACLSGEYCVIKRYREWRSWGRTMWLRFPEPGKPNQHELNAARKLIWC